MMGQVVGEKEKAERLVNVRTRDNKVDGMHALSEVISQLVSERDSRSLVPIFGKNPDTIAAVGRSAAAEAPEHPGEGKIA